MVTLEQKKSIQQKGSPTEALLLFQILRVKFYVWCMWYHLVTQCAGKRWEKKAELLCLLIL